ncbi:MAG: GGDEF domain-containing protein [Burkholderiales bacterium PBB5]|nr:MAG: GGDEF domain-containing protein [Burkholderiales bacterium PBB5]
MTRARIGAHDLAAVGDPIWVEFDQLPLLAAFPERQQALVQQAPLLLPGTPARAVFALVNERETVGVVEIDSDLPLDAAGQQLVRSILQIYRNFQALLDYSERDTLTGLLNRKTFDEAFFKLQAVQPPAPVEAADERRTAPARPQGHYLGVIDIDHFKHVNDSFGHLIGDEVLLLLARLMRGSFRFHDQLYRFGGEEFVVLLRCASDADAGRAFERLRNTVMAFAFPQVGTITISAGYTAVQGADTPSRAFERADKAVYWSKSHGRNQVTSHAALVAQGELLDDSHTGDVELF